MRSQRTRTAGFTVVEMMVAVTITGMVSVAVVQMLQVGRTSAERNRVMVDMQQNARVGLESLGDDLRHVSYGKDPTQPSIHYAGPDSVTFIADVMQDHAGAERISFFLSPDGDPDTPNPNDTILMRVVADTAGVPIFSAPQAYGIAPGGLAFRWFNGGGVELPNPVPQPEQVGEIFVALTAAASRELNDTYPTMTLSTTIYPRNLPLSPARSRPSSPGCQSLSYPNCESATLEWTTPTTNTDGTPLELVDISHFNIYWGETTETQSLYTRLARTITEWTVTGLTGGETYYLSVTCVSRSGVESYKCTQVADMTSFLTPEAPASLIAGSYLGAGVQLEWSTVTTFTSGDPITTPVSYKIFRDVTAGFTPDDDVNLLATVSYANSYADTTMAGCSILYYKVCAEACGNSGDPSPEVDGSLPAPPSCPSGLAAYSTGQPGEALVSWMAPTTRMDGSGLDPADIQGYVIYGDTLSGNQAVLAEVTGNETSVTLDGLLPCVTYYFNVRCVDDCAHEGDLCLGSEVAFFTSSGCDPEPPQTPASLTVTALDDRLHLEWPANREDCDLAGYRVHYGVSPGGPYDGYGADQGPSPIFVTSDQVTQGDVCRLDLTNLSECQSYYVVVTGVDQCSPWNESAPSVEGDGTTSCTPCQTSGCCVAWAVDGASREKLHLEVYTTNAGGETITRLIPSFSGPALVREVLYGRPLVPIWSHDGTSGGDGNVGAQPTGATLDIDDTIVPSWTSEKDGQPLMVVFDQDVRGTGMDLTFRGTSGQCTASGTGTGASRVEDFDDGNYTGWSSLSGNWAVVDGEVRQTLTGGNYLLKESSLSLSDLTFEAKVLVSGGNYHSAYLIFRMQSTSNYYLFGIRGGGQNRVRLAKVVSGNWWGELDYATRPILDNVWYTLRVKAVGGHIECWLDCEKVCDVWDSTWSSGSLALTTRYASAKFDDVKIFPGELLP